MKLQRIFDIPYYQRENFSQYDMLANKTGSTWNAYSTDEAIAIINKVSSGLINRGIEQGDKIAILSGNRPEWNFVDLGGQQIGAVTVPAYTQLSEEELEHIFSDAGVKLIFLEEEAALKKVNQIKDKLDKLEEVFCFSKIEDGVYWEELLEEEEHPDLADRKEKVDPDDLATLVYTSGTTGPPKGVMLTHENLLSNIKACTPLMPVDEKHKTLSFLPLNHVFERMLNYLYIANGISVYYAESVETVGDDLRDVSPHVFTTVPRLLEKVYEKIVAEGQKKGGVQTAIFNWALALAKNYELSGKSAWYRFQRNLADKLVFAKWRKALGGNVITIVSGGAPLRDKLNRVFHAAGITIMEGYGLTETSPVISVNRYEKEGRRIGTVGKPLENVEVRIADDGEILCKGPNVMKGYYSLEGKTNESMDNDWFKTEDIGEIDNDGFLSITDRKKSIFKTSGGKYVAPQRVEEEIKDSSMIAQAMVVGEGRKMVTALIVPDFDKLADWARQQGLSFDDRADLVEKEQVVKMIDQKVKQGNASLNQTEKVKKFRLLREEWTQEKGELTPTLKIKRPVLQDKFESLIEEMYEEE